MSQCDVGVNGAAIRIGYGNRIGSSCKVDNRIAVREIINSVGGVQNRSNRGMIRRSTTIDVEVELTGIVVVAEQVGTNSCQCQHVRSGNAGVGGCGASVGVGNGSCPSVSGQAGEMSHAGSCHGSIFGNGAVGQSNRVRSMAFSDADFDFAVCVAIAENHDNGVDVQSNVSRDGHNDVGINRIAAHIGDSDGNDGGIGDESSGVHALRIDKAIAVVGSGNERDQIRNLVFAVAAFHLSHNRIGSNRDYRFNGIIDCESDGSGVFQRTAVFIDCII